MNIQERMKTINVQEDGGHQCPKEDEGHQCPKEDGSHQCPKEDEGHQYPREAMNSQKKMRGFEHFMGDRKLDKFEPRKQFEWSGWHSTLFKHFIQ